MKKVQALKDKNNTVFVTRKLPDVIEKRMEQIFDVEFSNSEQPLPKKTLIEKCKNANIIVPTLGDIIDRTFLEEAGKNLKLIANYGAGFDHIDVRAAQKSNITVSNTPDVLTQDTADFTLSLILGITRRLPEGTDIMAKGMWKGWAPTALLGTRIFGKNLGIIGMGRIGQAVASRAKNFGLNIHYHNRKRLHRKIEQELEAAFWKNLDKMLPEVDILTIHVPHTPATFHLLNARRLKLLKKTAFLVNTARGEIIDETALTKMLRLNQLGGAGLDVYEHGKNINPRLQDLKNVLLLPHMGSATLEGRIEMGEKVIFNIKAFIDGHCAPDQILPDML